MCMPNARHVNSAQNSKMCDCGKYSLNNNLQWWPPCRAHLTKAIDASTLVLEQHPFGLARAARRVHDDSDLFWGRLRRFLRRFEREAVLEGNGREAPSGTVTATPWSSGATWNSV